MGNWREDKRRLGERKFRAMEKVLWCRNRDCGEIGIIDFIHAWGVTSSLMMTLLQHCSVSCFSIPKVEILMRNENWIFRHTPSVIGQRSKHPGTSRVQRVSFQRSIRRCRYVFSIAIPPLRIHVVIHCLLLFLSYEYLQLPKTKSWIVTEIIRRNLHLHFRPAYRMNDSCHSCASTPVPRVQVGILFQWKNTNDVT